MFLINILIFLKLKSRLKLLVSASLADLDRYKMAANAIFNLANHGQTDSYNRSNGIASQGLTGAHQKAANAMKVTAQFNTTKEIHFGLSKADLDDRLEKMEKPSDDPKGFEALVVAMLTTGTLGMPDELEKEDADFNLKVANYKAEVSKRLAANETLPDETLFPLPKAPKEPCPALVEARGFLKFYQDYCTVSFKGAPKNAKLHYGLSADHLRRVLVKEMRYDMSNLMEADTELFTGEDLLPQQVRYRFLGKAPNNETLLIRFQKAVWIEGKEEFERKKTVKESISQMPRTEIRYVYEDPKNRGNKGGDDRNANGDDGRNQADNKWNMILLGKPTGNAKNPAKQKPPIDICEDFLFGRCNCSAVGEKKLCPDTGKRHWVDSIQELRDEAKKEGSALKGLSENELREINNDFGKHKVWPQHFSAPGQKSKPASANKNDKGRPGPYTKV